MDEKPLNEILRVGTERLLKLAVQSKIEGHIEKYKWLKDAGGNQRVVRNGYHKNRELISGIGKIMLKLPRAKDKKNEIRFHSNIIPPYLRRVKKIDEFIPYLYLKGISTGDFSGVLTHLLGEEVSLSAGTVVRLKEKWLKEYENWNDRDLSGKKYVYW